MIRAADAEVLASAAAVGNLALGAGRAGRNQPSGGWRPDSRWSIQTLFPLVVVMLGMVVFFLAMAYFLPLVKLITELRAMTRHSGVDRPTRSPLPTNSRRRRAAARCWPKWRWPTVMLMIAMTLTVKVLGWVALERRAAEHRQRAVLEVANVMERITAYPFEEVTPDLARRITLSATARQSLPDSELAVESTDSEPGGGPIGQADRDPAPLAGRSGEWDAPVRLTSWIERRRTGIMIPERRQKPRAIALARGHHDHRDPDRDDRRRR